MITKSNRSVSALFVLCVFWHQSLAARAAIIRVPHDQPSIGAALAVAMSGDEVVVEDGQYAGADNRNLDFAGRAIQLRSVNGPENCIIDCEHLGRAFLFASGEDSD